MDPLVTIAIPTYNRADANLRTAIDAALEQTYRTVEVLVADNASTDSTSKLQSSISDPRFRYVRHEKNIGANANFNFLLNEAAGTWFLLLHDDDLVDKDFVESCLAAVEPGKQYGFIRTGVRSIDVEGNILRERPNIILGPTREDFYMSWFTSQTGLYLCNTLYHTDRLRQVGGFYSRHHLMEDNCALVKLLENWDQANVIKSKASYRYTYNQRTYQVPVVEWCEDFQDLLSMIQHQCSPTRRAEISQFGRRFFGKLCVRRANAISSRWKQIIARLTIARFFGLRTLSMRWAKPS
jgi:glycosyltransferase involved in cell wall biosynthesis